MNSILSTIKKMLGLDPDYHAFDVDIIVDINSALMTLNQLGVGPKKGLFITGPGETWDELLLGHEDLESAKAYIYLKTRLLFDPPSTSFVLDAFNKQAQEFEWRLNVQAENDEDDLPVEGGDADDGTGVFGPEWADADR